MKAPDLASYRVRVPACQLFQYNPHDFVVVSSSSSKLLHVFSGTPTGSQRRVDNGSSRLLKELGIPAVGVRKKLIAVGLPVTQQPPHRSRRAVFPHRALREYSLPQQD